MESAAIPTSDSVGVASVPVPSSGEKGLEKNAIGFVFPLKGMILGSTPTKLLHTSEYPVLVVPAKS
jgi:hypothetical protein